MDSIQDQQQQPRPNLSQSAIDDGAITPSSERVKTMTSSTVPDDPSTSSVAAPFNSPLSSESDTSSVATSLSSSTSSPTTISSSTESNRRGVSKRVGSNHQRPLETNDSKSRNNPLSDSSEVDKTSMRAAHMNNNNVSLGGADRSLAVIKKSSVKTVTENYDVVADSLSKPSVSSRAFSNRNAPYAISKKSAPKTMTRILTQRLKNPTVSKAFIIGIVILVAIVTILFGLWLGGVIGYRSKVNDVHVTTATASTPNEPLGTKN
jgi:hypothetical protein